MIFPSHQWNRKSGEAPPTSPPKQSGVLRTGREAIGAQHWPKREYEFESGFCVAGMMLPSHREGIDEGALTHS